MKKIKSPTIALTNGYDKIKTLTNKYLKTEAPDGEILQYVLHFNFFDLDNDKAKDAAILFLNDQLTNAWKVHGKQFKTATTFSSGLCRFNKADGVIELEGKTGKGLSKLQRLTAIFKELFGQKFTYKIVESLATDEESTLTEDEFLAFDFGELLQEGQELLKIVEAQLILHENFDQTTFQKFKKIREQKSNDEVPTLTEDDLIENLHIDKDLEKILASYPPHFFTVIQWLSITSEILEDGDPPQDNEEYNALNEIYPKINNIHLKLLDFIKTFQLPQLELFSSDVSLLGAPSTSVDVTYPSIDILQSIRGILTQCAKDGPTDSELEQQVKDLKEINKQLSTESDDPAELDFDSDFDELFKELDELQTILQK